MSDFTALEVGLIQCGLIDKHGEAVGFKLPHHILDGGLTEIVGARFHGQPVNANDRILNVFDTFHHLRGNELLAGAVCIHNSFDKVLWHLIIVGQQLLSVLRQAVSAIAKAGVVITVTDA